MPLPEATLSYTDPGDEILRRFRYQISYAAILAIEMVNDDVISEIFCELHEDILVKHSDGKYIGIQIKTKDINLPPFNINDDAIIKSITKFVKLEINYPDIFKIYSIISNAGFDKSNPSVCINTLIDKIKNGESVLQSRTTTKKIIEKIATECACSNDMVIQTIGKIRLKSFCALEDIHFKLINQIKSLSFLSGIQESKIEELADLVLTKTHKASSLAFSNDLIHTYVLGLSDEKDDISSIITSKRIVNSELKAWLEAQKLEPVKILLKDRNEIVGIPKGYRRLEIKMDAGKIDADNIDLIRNFKFSFENHAISWLYKNGIDDAEKKYNQITYITQNLCKEVYDEERISENKNGIEMLIKIRERIKERISKEPSLFFDCTYEHLLGTVGVLTESCKVWWSDKFDIEE